MGISPLKSANVNWDQNGTPSSSQFDDVYFSKDSGLEESQFVFFANNHLAQRWQQFPSSTYTFTIAETGFGTGLNFLMAWSHWLAIAPPNAKLHFISAELFPLTKQDIDTAISQWPKLSSLAKQLLEQYPALVPGYHHCHFQLGNVQLTLMFGDAQTMYSNLQTHVDAWFLDGFAPAKNPDMWQQGLFHAMARLSKQDTTFSTFTAAGIVKRGLTSAGFHVEKTKGFGRKRDMLRGSYHASVENSQHPISKPWFHTAHCSIHHGDDKGYHDKHAIVIGAGLSGCSTAAELARRGWKVCVLDKAPSPAQGASGNRQGVLYYKPSVDHNISSRFYLAGYLFSLKQFQTLSGTAWHPSGLIQLASTDSTADKHQAFLHQQAWAAELINHLSATEVSEQLGLNCSHTGLFFSSGGWAEPNELCQHWLNHKNITCIYNTDIINIKQDAHGCWHIQSQDHTWQTKHVILANAVEAKNLLSDNYLPVKAIRGQISYVPKEFFRPLSRVICSSNYVGPLLDDNTYSVGATFNLNNTSEVVNLDDHLENLTTLHQTIPDLFRHSPKEILQAKPELLGRVGFRCASADYLPLVGPVPHQEYFIDDYKRLRNDKTLEISTPPRYHQGLYLNIGHGSKGLTSCPISAAIIASYIEGESLPIEKSLSDALLPARFLIRQLIRNKL